MKRRLGKSILLLALCVSFAGCGTGMTENLNLEDTLPIQDIKSSDDCFTIKKVGVYLDVTPSMAGFLGMDTEEYEALVPQTKYEICVDEVNKILAVQYDRNQMAYYRVDTPLWLAEENVLKEANKKEYGRQLCGDRFDAVSSWKYCLYLLSGGMSDGLRLLRVYNRRKGERLDTCRNAGSGAVYSAGFRRRDFQHRSDGHWGAFGQF